jgi:hypothetical protein
MCANKASTVPYRVNIQYRGRGEIGGEYLPSQLERTPDIVKGGGRTGYGKKKLFEQGN